METKDIVLLAVTLLILGEVSYLLAKLPRTTMKAKTRPILIDTSVLMDGRIVNLAATGFMGGTLVVPRSVIGELQFLADNADADKRARARQGLDIVSELQNMKNVEVELLQDGSKAEEGVDERLLTLAKRHNAVICTLDYNLNKVAVVEGIQVLNINELAQSLRMRHLPGEQMLIELTQKGQDAHQGIGHLPDGTMVVVEQASGLIGKSVQVEVVRSLQTAAGRMMFAKRVDLKQPSRKPATTAPREHKARTNAGRKPAQSQSRASTVAPVTRPAGEQTSPQKVTQPKPNHKPIQKPAQRTPQKGPQNARRTGKRVDHESALVELINQGGSLQR